MGDPGRFRFSLARVLSVRETELSLEKQKVTEANYQLRLAVEAVEEAEHQVSALERELSARRDTPIINIDECLQTETFLTIIKARLLAAAKVADERKSLRDRAIEIYHLAKQKVRVLERLRESRKDEHAQARRAFETKTMDEVASQRSQNSEASPSER
ncbi:MAG: flagellar FliJ family protein [Planctomycetota bacterium]